MACRWRTSCSQPLPWNLAEVVRSQIDDLEPSERHVIETAAVLGRRVSFDVLAAVTGVGEAELIAVLRGLIGSGLLVEADPDVFGFRHDLTREAIEGRLLGRERRRIHEAALEALRRTGSSDLAAMARHAEGAGHHDELVDLARRGAEHYQSIGSSYQALGLAELGPLRGRRRHGPPVGRRPRRLARRACTTTPSSTPAGSRPTPTGPATSSAGPRPAGC